MILNGYCNIKYQFSDAGVHNIAENANAQLSRRLVGLPLGLTGSNGAGNAVDGNYDDSIYALVPANGWWWVTLSTRKVTLSAVEIRQAPNAG